jgi:LysM repeat protein
MTKRLLLFLAIFALLLPSQVVFAQSTSNPVYIVQPGDTINVIAFRFGVAVQDLIDANSITDPDSVAAGTPLVIPGLEGVSGTLTTQIVPLGESLSSLSRRYHLSLEQLIRLNRITSPTEIFAGASIILPESDQTASSAGMATLKQGQSLLEVAVSQGKNPWEIAAINDYGSVWSILPGEMLYGPSEDGQAAFSPISPAISAPAALKYRSALYLRPYMSEKSFSMFSITSFVLPYTFSGAFPEPSVIGISFGSPYTAAVDENITLSAPASMAALNRLRLPDTLFS